MSVSSSALFSKLVGKTARGSRLVQSIETVCVRRRSDVTSPPDGRDRPWLHGLLTSKAPPTRTPILAVGVPTSVSQHDKNKHAHLPSDRYLSRGPRRGMRQDRCPFLGIGKTYLFRDPPSPSKTRADEPLNPHSLSPSLQEAVRSSPSDSRRNRRQSSPT
ncbi:hypothetical protein OH76DRAFT_906677 [Lentinus brumalis]|uniref:Uncharacterized protein n=1 Tax=Lentinus brumalis TaxID=2498619 RepID=A0A371D0J1_9APHY|nr:hypothetical protein OH76DRAFT_906677 [Polyporus brumalis]